MILVEWLKRLGRLFRKRRSKVGVYAAEPLPPTVMLPGGRVLTNFNAANVHDRDYEIVYDKKDECYRYYGIRLTRVREFVDRSFEPFDEVGQAYRVAKKRGLDVMELRDRWFAIGEEARQAGALLHRCLEGIFMNKPESVPSSFEFYDRRKHTKRVVSLINEINQLTRFRNESGLIPYRTLWLVYDNEACLITRLDLVARDVEGRWILVDLVRSDKLGFEDNGTFCLSAARNYGRGRGYLKEVPDGEYDRSSLSLAVGAKILRKYYDIKVARTCLLIVHSSFTTYHLIDSESYDSESDSIIYEAYAAFRP